MLYNQFLKFFWKLSLYQEFWFKNIWIRPAIIKLFNIILVKEYAIEEYDKD